jgi:hypothetical protein
MPVNRAPILLRRTDFGHDLRVLGQHPRHVHHPDVICLLQEKSVLEKVGEYSMGTPCLADWSNREYAVSPIPDAGCSLFRPLGVCVPPDGKEVF